MRYFGTCWLTLVTAAFVAATLSFSTVTPAVADDDECFDCHDVGGAAGDEGPQYVIDKAAWEASVHYDAGCSNCHLGTDDYPHDEDAGRESCAECHDEASEEFSRSLHKQYIDTCKEDCVWPRGDPCAACHGVHDTRAIDDPESRVYYQNIPNTCGACHGDVAMVTAQGLTTAPFENFQHSVHGKTNGNGNGEGDGHRKPAVCTSCHGTHLLVRATNPASRINPFNIAKTCGQCHEGESKQYVESVHGTAFQKGVSSAPTCTNCHGTHSIKMVPHEDGTPMEQRLVRSTCVACHASEALVSEYGPAPERVRTYQASYHGLALKRGATTVADCASCHGVHAIYPSSDPRSTVSPLNLEKTCGNCHPGADQVFIKNPVHFTTKGEPTLDVVIISWVTWAYWWLIIGVIGGMIAHNAVILSYYVRRKRRHEKSMRQIKRFTRGQTIQHAILLITFFTLALTGFALAYPDIWWSRWLEALGLNEELRRWVHRGAAIGMMAVSVYHVIWSAVSGYGRKELGRIRPGINDVREVVDNLRFHLGSSDQLPHAGKYDYPAKMEYWALVWGTIVMAVTGLILWFPVKAALLLPFWAVKVAEVVHLFEAWLATLAILVFHFFYVMGHPEVYPISFAMFTGDMPEEEAERHHPDWVAQERQEHGLAGSHDAGHGSHGGDHGAHQHKNHDPWKR